MYITVAMQKVSQKYSRITHAQAFKYLKFTLLPAISLSPART